MSYPGEDVGMTDPSGASMSVPTGTEYEPRQSVQPATPQTQKPAQTGLGRGGTTAVQNWQRRYNRQHGFKPGMPGYLKDDGVWGPATKAAYQQMQAAKQPATPANREMPPMPGQQQAPAPAAPRGDLWAPVKQQVQLSLFPHAMQMMGVKNVRELPVNAISQLKQLMKQEVDRAVADVGNTQFRDDKSRDEYIRNIALQNLRSNLTPEVVRSLRAG